jgi:hypothetical protein
MDPDELLADSNARTQYFSQMNPVGKTPAVAPRACLTRLDQA